MCDDWQTFCTGCDVENPWATFLAEEREKGGKPSSWMPTFEKGGHPSSWMPPMMKGGKPPYMMKGGKPSYNMKGGKYSNMDDDPDDRQLSNEEFAQLSSLCFKFREFLMMPQEPRDKDEDEDLGKQTLTMLDIPQEYVEHVIGVNFQHGKDFHLVTP